MTEYRLADYRYRELEPNLAHAIRHIVRRYSDSNGYDHEFEYYWAKFSDASWLLAVLDNSEACEVLYNGKA